MTRTNRSSRPDSEEPTLEPIVEDDESAPSPPHDHRGRALIVSAATLATVVIAIFGVVLIRLERDVKEAQRDATFARDLASRVQRQQGTLGDHIVELDETTARVVEQQRLVSVVDVVGLDSRTAAAITATAGMAARIVGRGRVVVAQDPAAGTAVARGAEVVLSTDG